MCQLLGMNCNVPTNICFSFKGFAARSGRTADHQDGYCTNEEVVSTAMNSAKVHPGKSLFWGGLTVFFLLISTQQSLIWAQSDRAGIDQPLLPGIEEILVQGMEKGIKADYRGAIADFSQVILLQPNLSDAYFNRGLAYQKLGAWQNAIADFNQTLKIDQGFADAYLARGRVYLNLKQRALARQDFQAAVTEFRRQGNDWGYQQAIEELQSASAP